MSASPQAGTLSSSSSVAGLWTGIAEFDFASTNLPLIRIGRTMFPALLSPVGRSHRIFEAGACQYRVAPQKAGISGGLVDFRDRRVIVTGGTGALGAAVVGGPLGAGAFCYVPWPSEATGGGGS